MTKLETPRGRRVRGLLRPLHLAGACRRDRRDPGAAGGDDGCAARLTDRGPGRASLCAGQVDHQGSRRSRRRHRAGVLLPRGACLARGSGAAAFDGTGDLVGGRRVGARRTLASLAEELSAVRGATLALVRSLTPRAGHAAGGSRAAARCQCARSPVAVRGASGAPSARSQGAVPEPVTIDNVTERSSVSGCGQRRAGRTRA